MKNPGNCSSKALYLVLFLSIVLAGCSNRGNVGESSAKPDRMKVEVIVEKDDYLALRNVTAYQESDKIQISGLLRRIGARSESHNVHVDYALVSEDGSIVKSGRVECPTFTVKQGTHELLVNFPAKAEKGFHVHLAVHPGDGPVHCDTLLLSN